MELQSQHFIYLILLFAGCGYAAFRGGAPERWGAGMVFGGVVLTNVAVWLEQLHFAGPEVGQMWVDILLAAALTLLATRADQFWPMWAAAVQIDEVLTHILMFSPYTGSFSYAFALWLFSLPLPILVGVGAWRHRHRVRIYGGERDWSLAQ